MQTEDVPNLDTLKYSPLDDFLNQFGPNLVQAIWEFMKRQDNLVRMETATFLERPAVEPLGPKLERKFGLKPQQLQNQMIGHMAREIMEAMGYEKVKDEKGEDLKGTITGNLFKSGQIYQPSP